MMSEQYDAWLAGLKVGDPVYVRRSGGGGKRPASPGKVTRVTATQIILEPGSKFRRRDGSSYSDDSWSWMRLEQPTEEHRTEVHIYNLRVKARELIDKLIVPNEEGALKAFIAAVEPYVIKK
jgi:hypothetical protein